MADQDDLIDFGEEPADPAVTPLEKKYSEQMRQIVSQKIDLPISTLPEMIKEQINLNPDFQRRDRWDEEKQSRFIESIIMNVPIPPIFLGEDQYGSYVVLDGCQRLTAINEFLKNNFKLTSLKVWEDLNGQSFNDLQKKKLDLKQGESFGFLGFEFRRVRSRRGDGCRCYCQKVRNGRNCLASSKRSSGAPDPS